MMLDCLVYPCLWIRQETIGDDSCVQDSSLNRGDSSLPYTMHRQANTELGTGDVEMKLPSPIFRRAEYFGVDRYT